MNGLSKPKYLTTESMTRIALMSAISTVLGFFPQIKMVFFAPWLKLDFTYLPMLLTGFSMGFIPGLIVLTINNLIQLIATESAGVGQLADMIMGICMLLPTTMIYKTKRTRKHALIGMLFGVIAMVSISVPTNQFLLFPFYSKMSGQYVIDYLNAHPLILLTAVIPFNLLKGIVVCVITYFIYKPLSHFLKKGLKA